MVTQANITALINFIEEVDPAATTESDKILSLTNLKTKNAYNTLSDSEKLEISTWAANVNKSDPRLASITALHGNLA